MSLDDKLRVIYYRCDVSNNRTDKPLGEIEAIAQIKKCFADEGYLPLSSHQPPLTMTGQEWYDRFEKELDNYTHFSHQEVVFDDGIIPEEVLEAAEKASGIE